MYPGTSLARVEDAGVADRQLRLLALAVLCSLLLHALILLFLANLREFSQARGAPPPLTARIAKPKPPPEPPIVAPAPRPPVTRTVPSAKPQAQPLPAPIPPSPTPVLSIEPTKPATESTLVVPTAPAQPVAEAQTQPVPAAATGPDPASVARFRLELMEIAARYERYPRIARDNDWEGRVELLVSFAENGAIATMSVKRGTGRAVLDEEAQAMIRSAQPHAVIPPALRGRAFALEIAVLFRLKK